VVGERLSLLGDSVTFTFLSGPLKVALCLVEVFGLSCSDGLHRYSYISGGNHVADCLVFRAPSIVAPTWRWTAPTCSSFVFGDVCSRSSIRFVDFHLD